MRWHTRDGCYDDAAVQTDPNSATRSLMAAGERVDPFDEELALAALERELFAGRTPAPVLDRYVLLGKIGCGGQGVVFRAYDPDLDRRVALKLLRVERAALGRNVPSLLAEARILAQVAHPEEAAHFSLRVSYWLQAT